LITSSKCLWFITHLVTAVWHCKDRTVWHRKDRSKALWVLKQGVQQKVSECF
jgi:hypothetical protein